MKIEKCPAEVKKYAPLGVRIYVYHMTERLGSDTCGILLGPCLVLTVRHSIERALKDTWSPKSDRIIVVQGTAMRSVTKIRIIDSLPSIAEQYTETMDIALLEIEKPGFPSTGLLFDRKDDKIFDDFWMPENREEICDAQAYWFGYNEKGIAESSHRGTIVNLIKGSMGICYVIKGDKMKEGMSGSGIYTFDGKFVGLHSASRFRKIFGFTFWRIGELTTPALSLGFLLKSKKIVTISP
ncbi:serine protease [Patescibacteria group bacterium AH-259-L07]|nr:serine protease [Patescibacteria group bacterium AH-259-L07]